MADQAAEANAQAIYGANVAWTRAEYAKREEALRLDYLTTDMCIVTFDTRLAGLRSELAYYLAAEADLYRLNRDHPLPVAA